MHGVTEWDVQLALCMVSTESGRADRTSRRVQEGVCGAVVGPSGLTPPGSGAGTWVPHFGGVTSKWHIHTSGQGGVELGGRRAVRGGESRRLASEAVVSLQLGTDRGSDSPLST